MSSRWRLYFSRKQTVYGSYIHSGANGFKLAMVSISEKLNGLDARIVHTQHDEIIVEARDDIADQVQRMVKDSMEKALEKIIPEVPFVAEIRVAEAWG
jgi:DNA polymerase I-like protein with 3'-5' exonuclease and polymerase domains